jgi:betaine reductase
VASAIPYVGHAWRRMREGSMNSTLLIAKGSLFLGRMTQMADGISVLMERTA